MGGGLVLNSDLHTGEHGAAAEIGHIPGFGDRLWTGSTRTEDGRVTVIAAINGRADSSSVRGYSVG